MPTIVREVHWPLFVLGEISQQLIALYYSAGSTQYYHSKIKIICVCIDSELLFFYHILYLFAFFSI